VCGGDDNYHFANRKGKLKEKKKKCQLKLAINRAMVYEFVHVYDPY
jgi:hypothetical protein